MRIWRGRIAGGRLGTDGDIEEAVARDKKRQNSDGHYAWRKNYGEKQFINKLS
jgi:hypothetical protein